MNEIQTLSLHYTGAWLQNKHTTLPPFLMWQNVEDCSPRVMKLVLPSLISAIAKSPQTSDRLSITFSSFRFNGKLIYLYGSSETRKLELMAHNLIINQFWMTRKIVTGSVNIHNNFNQNFLLNSHVIFTVNVCVANT